MPGALFDDHAPQRYFAGEGIGESRDWKDLLITTVDCGLTWLAMGPQAVKSTSKINTDPSAIQRNLFIIILSKAYPMIVRRTVKKAPIHSSLLLTIAKYVFICKLVDPSSDGRYFDLFL